MRYANITITDEAVKHISVEGTEGEEVKKRIIKLCSENKLSHSSVAILNVVDGELVIVTSMGSLIVDNQLTSGTRYQGNPKGHIAGTNANGHKLPSSSASSHR